MHEGLNHEDAANIADQIRRASRPEAIEMIKTLTIQLFRAGEAFAYVQLEEERNRAKTIN